MDIDSPVDIDILQKATGQDCSIYQIARSVGVPEEFVELKRIDC